MLSLEDAIEKILAAVVPLPSEILPLVSVDDRFVAERLCSTLDLPPADNSAMDGYAVRSPDLRNASAEAPGALKLAGRIPAGEVFSDELKSGECLRIFTGSMMPRGADAVLIQEDTRAEGEMIFCLDKVRPWENVRMQGEDVKKGAALIDTGEKITAPRLALLASAGLGRVSVFGLPKVGLLATGNELREAGQPLPTGGIYESNRGSLAAFLKKIGVTPKIYPLVPDDLASTRTALEKAFSECDAVITTGGVSVGELDWVKTAFTEMGGELDFWKVNIRPGKPFVFGRWQNKFLFGLPGNPVSAMVTYFLLARPALLKMQGAKNVSPLAHPGVLAEPLANRSDRRHFTRVSVDEKGFVRSSGVQAAHVLSGIVSADGLVDVPPQTMLTTGATVSVMRWD